MQFNGELATVSSWPGDGEQDHNSVTLKVRQWRGDVAVLSQTLCGGLSSRIRFSGSSRPPDTQGALYGRRGAESKSSFDVCLSDFEWAKPDEGEKTRSCGV